MPVSGTELLASQCPLCSEQYFACFTEGLEHAGSVNSAGRSWLREYPLNPNYITHSRICSSTLEGQKITLGREKRESDLRYWLRLMNSLRSEIHGSLLTAHLQWSITVKGPRLLGVCTVSFFSLCYLSCLLFFIPS